METYTEAERILLIVRGQLEDHLNGYPDSELYETLGDTLRRVERFLRTSGISWE